MLRIDYQYKRRHFDCNDVDSNTNSHSDTDDSDENHKEIDYPDEEEVEAQMYDSDEEENSDMYTRHTNIIFQDIDENEEQQQQQQHEGKYDHVHDIEIGKIVTCCVCSNTCPTVQMCMDELDHNFTFVISASSKVALLNPCRKHYICVPCIRASLLTTPLSVLMDGQGNIPCLGDVQCTNLLQQRTTTYLYQVRELFTDQEWQNISHVAKMYRTSNQSLVDFHPYMIPLTESQKLTTVQIVDRICHIINQEHPCIQCSICAVHIQKTTACFAMRHCDWETCWMCGKVERRLSSDHWKTCPRYDSNPFWKTHGYLCKEGSCFDEDRSCDHHLHKKGRESMDLIRKIYQLYGLFKSLSVGQQTDVISHLKQNNRWEQCQTLLSQFAQYEMR